MDTLRAIAPALACTLVMAGAVVLLDRGLAPDGISGLLAIVALAAVVALATLATVSAETVTSARNVIRSAMTRA
jgi:hypothetical protein